MARRTLRQVLSDPQIITLAVVALAAAAALYLLGRQLAPFLIAVVLAYFLDGGVAALMRRGLSRAWAFAAVFSAFLVVYVVAIAGPLQLAVRRSIEFAASIPRDPGTLADLVERLPDPSLGLLSPEQTADLREYVTSQLAEGLDYVIAELVQAVPQFTGWLIYLFLIPLLVFFLLKDKDVLLREFVRCLPRNRELVDRVWQEMEVKMGAYVRGKIWEILIVGAVTGVALWALDFRYPVILGFISGISVLVPYVGAIGVALPILLVGYGQWGLSWHLGWVMIAYTVIQMLDGNVLVPVIFAEAVKLHPATILLAIVVFGSLWGLLGVFFAIPLATLAKSLLVTVLDFRDRAEGA